jgi:hypothetical protein
MCKETSMIGHRMFANEYVRRIHIVRWSGKAIMFLFSRDLSKSNMYL